MKIWVDDVRPMPADYDLHCYSTNEAISAIRYIEMKQKYNIEVLDLDHDAGDYAKDGGDYIKILDWLEANHINIPIAIHSRNPVGVQKMRQIIAHNHWTLVRY